MPYRVLMSAAAERDMRALDRGIARRIQERLVGLRDDPRSHGTKKLKGSTRYRIREGDYRITYDIDDKESVVVVAHIGHRREIYRK